jgi:hypothetical protein
MPDPISTRLPSPQPANPPNQPDPSTTSGTKGDDPTKAAQQAADQGIQKSQQDDQKAQAEAQAKAQAQSQADAVQKASQLASLDQASGVGLPKDFMNVMDSIVKEGYETAKAPSSGKMGDQDMQGNLGQKNMTQDLQKDLTTLREFMREAKYLIDNQGMTVAQMFNMVKVEQGGAFWQKLQQVLQKGVPGDALLFSKKGDPADPAQMEAALKNLVASSEVAEAMKTPGRAILELMKAEVNPQNQLANFLAALKILDKDGMSDSANRLRSYLRKRGDVPEEAIQYYFDQKKEIFEGPFPKEPIQPVNWWYILLALGAFGTSITVGLNLWESLLMGIGMAALMFFLSFIYKR